MSGTKLSSRLQHLRFPSGNTHTHTHTHIYIYIYIYREREREREKLHMGMFVFLYLYMCRKVDTINKGNILNKVKLATVGEGDPKAPFFDCYYTNL